MIPFNVPHLVGSEIDNISAALKSRQLSGDRAYSKGCETQLSKWLSDQPSLVVPSGTAALELACIVADFQPGDEVIMPSYTFSSTANAVVLRGGVPVFVDILPGTLNVDPSMVERAVTPKTRGILPVHYAGLVCDMSEICEIAHKNKLVVIEDAAQALGSFYNGQPAGTLGDMAAFSFHETKNIVAGEAGAFTTKHDDWHARAQIIREKGTNRAEFIAGQVDKYSWVDVGSSFLAAEIVCAFLNAQFSHLDTITKRRVEILDHYRAGLKDFESRGWLALQTVPQHCQINGHIACCVLDDRFDREAVMRDLLEKGVQTTSHYVPLHSSTAGRKFGRAGSSMIHTDRAGSQLLRLPIYADLTDVEVDTVLHALDEVLNEHAR
jgi:dTDP-4-amino-4,6-dideoxygalactose transaminase